jgi:hypothetical protein
MKYDYLHEKETVHLKDVNPRPWTEIAAALASLGFTLNDDNYSLDRKDHVHAWQTDSYVWMIVFLNDQEVFEEQWNRIELRYLLATLPQDGIKVFTEKVSGLAAKLKLSMIYNGEPVTKQALETKLNACATELAENLGEPGSEEVAIFIESTYPRR